MSTDNTIKTRHQFGEKVYEFLDGEFKWFDRCVKCPLVRVYGSTGGIRGYIPNPGDKIHSTSIGIPGCIGSNTKQEKQDMEDSRSVLTGIKVNLSRFTNDITPSEKPQPIPQEDTKRPIPKPIELEHFQQKVPEKMVVPTYTSAEAWAKELMVALKLFYEAFQTNSIDSKVLAVVENKLEGSEFKYWLKEFKAKKDAEAKYRKPQGVERP